MRELPKLHTLRRGFLFLGGGVEVGQLGGSGGLLDWCREGTGTFQVFNSPQPSLRSGAQGNLLGHRKEEMVSGGLSQLGLSSPAGALCGLNPRSAGSQAGTFTEPWTMSQPTLMPLGQGQGSGLDIHTLGLSSVPQPGDMLLLFLGPQFPL